MLAWLGQPVTDGLRGLSRGAGLLVGVARRLATPAFWRRTTTRALAEQLVLIGVDGLRFVAIVAVLIGLGVVLQAQVWLTRVGQSTLIGPFLATIVVREVAPLVTAFILIGRTGSAMVAELWTMRARGEVHALDAQGVDPFDLLVVPRVAATTFAALALVLAFVAIALIAGYVVGFASGATRLPLLAFLDGVLGSLRASDAVAAGVKCVLPAAIASAVACAEGLDDGFRERTLPAAIQSAFARSLLALAAVFALMTTWDYLL